MLKPYNNLMEYINLRNSTVNKWQNTTKNFIEKHIKSTLKIKKSRKMLTSIPYKSIILTKIMSNSLKNKVNPMIISLLLLIINSSLIIKFSSSMEMILILRY
jgi:hypothetical protein